MKKMNNSIITNHRKKDGTPKIITINGMADMAKYYKDDHNQYWFNYSVKFTCDINVKASIWAENIEGNNITCEMLRTLGEINIDNLKADLIECEELAANKVTCNTLKHVAKVEVDNLSARIVRGCGKIIAKTFSTISTECEYLQYEEFKSIEGGRA